MWKMIEYAEMLVDTLRDLGDFFTNTPAMQVPVLNINDMTWHIISVPLPFDFTLAELLIGAGLAGVLAFRLAKFYTDIVL